jgi:hypothetical protein
MLVDQVNRQQVDNALLTHLGYAEGGNPNGSGSRTYSIASVWMKTVQKFIGCSILT